MIQVTENARDKIKELVQAEGASAEAFVRVGVRGGGCSGLIYDLDFDTEFREGDQVFEDKGVKVVVDNKSFLYLFGTTLEYTDGLNGKGFQFINPNASRTCGCGESFAV
jgi:iron-sulfur cluster assembly protein